MDGRVITCRQGRIHRGQGVGTAPSLQRQASVAPTTEEEGACQINVMGDEGVGGSRAALGGSLATLARGLGIMCRRALLAVDVRLYGERKSNDRFAGKCQASLYYCEK